MAGSSFLRPASPSALEARATTEAPDLTSAPAMPAPIPFEALVQRGKRGKELGYLVRLR